MRYLVTASLLIMMPTLALSQDTVCETPITEIKITSSGGGFPAILSVKGEIFGGEFFRLCWQGGNTPAGKRVIRPGFTVSVVVTEQQCSQRLTAAELAMSLDMTLRLTYDPILQPDCEITNPDAYPYTFEIINGTPNT